MKNHHKFLETLWKHRNALYDRQILGSYNGYELPVDFKLLRNLPEGFIQVQYDSINCEQHLLPFRKTP